MVETRKREDSNGKRPLLLGLVVTGVLLVLAGAAWNLQYFLFRRFGVHNTGPRPIHVLAVGATPEGLVPIWSLHSPEFQEPIAPGAQAHFRYELDAMTLCGLLVVADGQALGMLKNPPEGSKCVSRPSSSSRLCCWPTDWDLVLEVPPPAQLEPIPEDFAALLSTP